jgi:hypothetical protein
MPDMDPDTLAKIAELLQSLSKETKNIQEQIRKADARSASRPARTRTSSGDWGPVKRKPRVLRKHYHSHQMNDGIRVDQPARAAQDTLYVYCYAHKHIHPLKECVLASFGPIIGAHWVCREYAKENNLEEVIVHV